MSMFGGVAEDFCLDGTGEVECQYLGGVHNSTHKSNPNPYPPPPPFSPPCEQRNSFHERAPQINEPIVVVMTSGEQLLPFGVFMDSVKKGGTAFSSTEYLNFLHLHKWPLSITFSLGWVSSSQKLKRSLRSYISMWEMKEFAVVQYFPVQEKTLSLTLSISLSLSLSRDFYFLPQFLRM